jgi:hypothetical protein
MSGNRKRHRDRIVRISEADAAKSPLPANVVPLKARVS